MRGKVKESKGNLMKRNGNEGKLIRKREKGNDKKGKGRRKKSEEKERKEY